MTRASARGTGIWDEFGGGEGGRRSKGWGYAGNQSFFGIRVKVVI